MLELKKSKDVTADKFVRQIAMSLRQEVDIRPVGHRCLQSAIIQMRSPRRRSLMKLWKNSPSLSDLIKDKNAKENSRWNTSRHYQHTSAGSIQIFNSRNSNNRVGYGSGQGASGRRCFRCLGFGHIVKAWISYSGSSQQCRRKTIGRL